MVRSNETVDILPESKLHSSGRDLRSPPTARHPKNQNNPRQSQGLRWSRESDLNPERYYAFLPPTLYV